MKGKRVIKEIKIKNYRGLKQIMFSPKSINVIVGPNDTGKSSILEAIGLLISSGNDFRDMLLENEIPFCKELYLEDFIDYLLNFREYSSRYLIRAGAYKSEIYGKIKNTDYTLAIEYSKLLKQDDKNKLVISFLNEIATENAKLTVEFGDIMPPPRGGKVHKKDIEKIKQENFNYFLQRQKLFFTLYKRSEIQNFYIHFDIKEEKEEEPLIIFPMIDVAEKVFSKGRIRIPLILNFSKLSFSSNIGRLYDLVFKKGKIPATVRELSKKIPYITDIGRTEEEIYISTSRYREPIPLSSMGDGFISLLKISFLAALAEEGILILEEPEASLHPAFLDIIAEKIVNSSELSQFFISTHSLDFLYSLLKKAEETEKTDGINVVRLHRKGSDILTEIMDGSEAKIKIDEIGLDLRQT